MKTTVIIIMVLMLLVMLMLGIMDERIMYMENYLRQILDKLKDKDYEKGRREEDD